MRTHMNTHYRTACACVQLHTAYGLPYLTINGRGKQYLVLLPD